MGASMGKASFATSQATQASFFAPPLQFQKAGKLAGSKSSFGYIQSKTSDDSGDRQLIGLSDHEKSKVLLSKLAGTIQTASEDAHLEQYVTPMMEMFSAFAAEHGDAGAAALIQNTEMIVTRSSSLMRAAIEQKSPVQAREPCANCGHAGNPPPVFLELRGDTPSLIATGAGVLCLLLCVQKLIAAGWELLAMSLFKKTFEGAVSAGVSWASANSFSKF